ncbi:MAG: FAD-binding oxidoreductase [Mesorhizobium sp.]|uniref:NAD(P)/FAD-dependent oxidoreductase n=1 Tax=unclassified Mesorhizobium TaxID=325217 RepID=UPI000FCBC0D6|nr:MULTISPECIES: FAD-binding oxidoreductase [unclassified Mesorhizobium]RUV67847.1 FAD-binding oxidoreductase [Mesorhizobium sp. M5C.F.Cr.IN.023.01.1.1]RWB92796.1 MAG: FAD-binding oxidoreductase [Mesorhizobium sp.]RWJ06616.1 MAG: FAD-binding oxidoreductase [Mesorhizobium sp.]RWJ11152.1 MAG: FAD-binding oxidoreductase [Mesorhizobium sp.]RWJ61322.1 MAG: FAD-binding oxidoreductase [Mesorhizobium sp.]
MNYIDTLYSRTLQDQTERSPLVAAEQTDVCIVGAGLAGLTAALELVRAGNSVAVLEAQRVGWGASGRNGGFVGPGYAGRGETIRRMAGAADAKKLQLLSIEGVELVRNTIEDLGIASALPKPGITRVVRYEAAAQLQAEAEAALNDFGYPLEFLDRTAVQALLHSDRYYQGVRDPQAFHFHPLNYLRGIAAEIERLGGLIYENSAATSVSLNDAIKVVRTDRGSVQAKHVVFATGGYTGRLVPALKRSHLAISTYVMVSERAPELIRTAIETTDAIGDDRKAGDYYRVVDGGQRLLWGGRITTRTGEPRDLAAKLQRTMVSTYPQLKDLEIDTAWSGLMAYARHQMPQIGQLQPHVWYCTAFGGHGMNTATIGGKIIAEAILGTSDRFRLFQPFGLAWNGGPAGKIAAQLVYWKLQANDWLRERGA